jgi:hypothetical protein
VSIKKKAKGKGKKRAAAKRVPRARAKKGKDLAQVREGIDNKIKNSANKIADKVIEVAKTTGQLASAKYLFEAVGLYPPTEQTAAPVPLKDTLAGTLLARMGIPTEPVICEDDSEGEAASDLKNAKAETAMASADELEGEGNEPSLTDVEQ